MRELERPDIPDFEHAPVAEVALSTQFGPLEKLRLAHLGLLWGRFRELYPVIQEHNPLANPVEQFGQKPSTPQRNRVEISDTPEARFWFLDEPGSHLIQVQRDRFVRNWRGTGDDYPRYERIRKSFIEDYTTFVEFLEKEKIGSPETRQVEVTYVNHIFANDVWSQPGEADHVFAVCALRTRSGSLFDPW